MARKNCSDLKEILGSHKVPEMKKYAEILYSWTGSTAFGKMLDGESNVKLTKDLVTIEIRGLDNYKDLKDIFLLLFTSFIKNEAAKDLSRPYLLIIDEAARLFLTPSGKDFAIECYRVFRKYNAGIWCISQNYRYMKIPTEHLHRKSLYTSPYRAEDHRACTKCIPRHFQYFLSYRSCWFP